MPYYTKNTIARIENVFRRLQTSYYEQIAPLETTAYVTNEPLPYERRTEGEQKNLPTGAVWGTLFDCAWFHFTGKLPKGLKPEQCCLIIDVSGEGLCVDEAGDPLIGITNGSVAWEDAATRKRAVPLDLLAVKDGQIDLWMDAGCNGLFGDYHEGKLREAFIALRKDTLRACYYDFFILKELLAQLSPDSARYSKILFALNDACNALTDYTEEEAALARKCLEKELNKKGGDPSLTLTCIGHAHIDLAWLWPIRETIRKGARTFATVDRMMDRYPEYKFGFSQPQLLYWMKQYYPRLFECLQKRVREGRIECQGAMWVECDTNITGGEALVRQIILGQAFWKKEFGVEVNNIWLPDVFGYTAALPQIMKKSGIPYFMTQKLSWSEHNLFPHHTFNWTGIDGSTILTHMLPEGTYNSQGGPEALHKSETLYLDKAVSDEALVLFGVGDGGGGPGACHLEKLSRLHDLNGLPQARQGFACELFERLDQNHSQYKTWKGELYLEFHRGTYTTQARNKQYNRRIEQQLREAEFASVLAMLRVGTPYPAEALHTLWQETLLYQFHDIVPGSSIRRVYEESLARYAVMLDEAKSITASAWTALGGGAVNSLSHDRSEYIRYRDQWYHCDMAAMSAAPLGESLVSVSGISADKDMLENERLRVRFGENGSIVSIFDKAENRETLEAPANVFRLYDDSDGNAWDIMIYYDEKVPRYMTLVSSEYAIDGPDAFMKQVFSFGQSTLTQRVILQKDCPYVTFETTVDWQETQKMLRTGFTTCIYTDEVTCDIQFGCIKRPTHRNTSWDMTKFEICAHKWIDLSADDYGAAILSDSKYGFKALDNVLDINLLRSTMSPGVDADKALHTFRYAYYPHAGNEKRALVEQKALAFNIRPTVSAMSDSTKPADSFIRLDRPNVEITAVKKAEETDDIVVRLYQTDGVNTTCRIRFTDEIAAVFLCDLREREIEPLALCDQTVLLTFKPFEIYTLLLKRR